MLKRIIAVILGVLLMASVFAGCQFVERDTKRDMRRIVATVQPIEDSAFEGGKSKERHIYKYDLWNAVYEQFGQSTVPPTEEDVDNILQSLVERELIYLEIERMIGNGTLPWRDGTVEYTDEDGTFRDVEGVVNSKYHDFTDTNKIKRAQFDSIDQELRSLQKTILSSFDAELPQEGGQEDEASPEYPVRESETEDIEYPETTVWDILEDNTTEQRSRIPGKYGDSEKQSLERQALSNFVVNIVEVVRNHERACDEDKLKEAEDYYRSMIEQGKYEQLYLSLDQTYPIEFLTKESITRQVQSEALQKQLLKGIEVMDSEVAERYDAMLRTQKLNFADVSAYQTAVSNNETILYRPTGDLFYVKHILIPFSEAQTSALTAYKAGSNVVNADVVEYRDRLVGEIVAYPRDIYTGKEIISDRKSANNVFQEVYAAVSAASSNPKEAERIFDDFIYRYNTDPGAFTATAGYTMNKTFNADNRTYMEEFELGGEDLLNNYGVGQVLPYPVITDYGMHIMYYASNTTAGEVKQLGDYETVAEYKTIYEILETQIRTAYENRRLEQWTNEVINTLTRNENYKKTYKNRYKDIYAS